MSNGGIPDSYTVQFGWESVNSIAMKFFGSERFAKAIYNWNRHLFEGGRALRRGDVLFLGGIDSSRDPASIYISPLEAEVMMGIGGGYGGTPKVQQMLAPGVQGQGPDMRTGTGSRLGRMQREEAMPEGATALPLTGPSVPPGGGGPLQAHEGALQEPGTIGHGYQPIDRAGAGGVQEPGEGEAPVSLAGTLENIPPGSDLANLMATLAVDPVEQYRSQMTYGLLGVPPDQVPIGTPTLVVDGEVMYSLGMMYAQQNMLGATPTELPYASLNFCPGGRDTMIREAASISGYSLASYIYHNTLQFGLLGLNKVSKIAEYGLLWPQVASGMSVKPPLWLQEQHDVTLHGDIPFVPQGGYFVTPGNPFEEFFGGSMPDTPLVDLGKIISAGGEIPTGPGDFLQPKTTEFTYYTMPEGTELWQNPIAYWNDLLASDYNHVVINPLSGERGYWIAGDPGIGTYDESMGMFFVPEAQIGDAQIPGYWELNDPIYDDRGRIHWEQLREAQMYELDRLIRNNDGTINWDLLLGESVWESLWTDDTRINKEASWVNLALNMSESTGIAGISATLNTHPERALQLVEAIREGTPMAEALMAFEDPWAESIFNLVTDPFFMLGFGSGPLAKALNTIESALVPGLTAITQTGGILFRTGKTMLKPGGARAIYEVITSTPVGDFFIGLSKKSRLTQFSDNVADATQTLALRYNPVTDGPIQEYYQRMLLGSDDILSRLPQRQRMTIEDVIRLLDEEKLLGIEDLLKKHGVFENVPGPQAEVLIKELVGAENAQVVAHYVEAAATSAKAKELGVFATRPGSLAGRFDWLARLARENWLGANPRFIMQNYTDNTMKTIISGYSPSGFDLSTGEKLASYVEELFEIPMPRNVVGQSLLEEGLGLDVRYLSTGNIPIPFIGNPSQWGYTWRSVTGKAAPARVLNWLNGDSALVGILERYNYSKLLAAGLNVSSGVELGARATVFVQAFENRYFTRVVPDIVEQATTSGKVPRDVIAAIKRRVRKWSDWDTILRTYFPEEGLVPAARAADMIPETAPDFAFMQRVQDEIDRIEAFALDHNTFGNDGVIEDIIWKLDEASRAADQNFQKTARSIIENTETGIEELQRRMGEGIFDQADVPTRVTFEPPTGSVKDLLFAEQEFLDDINADLMARGLDPLEQGTFSSLVDPTLVSSQLEKAAAGIIPDNVVIGSLFEGLEDADAVSALAVKLQKMSPDEIMEAALAEYNRLYRQGMPGIDIAQPITGPGRAPTEPWAMYEDPRPYMVEGENNFDIGGFTEPEDAVGDTVLSSPADDWRTINFEDTGREYGEEVQWDIEHNLLETPWPIEPGTADNIRMSFTHSFLLKPEFEEIGEALVPKQIVDELENALRPGGRVFITEDTEYMEAISEALEASGLKRVQWEVDSEGISISAIYEKPQKPVEEISKAPAAPWGTPPKELPPDADAWMMDFMPDYEMFDPDNIDELMVNVPPSVPLEDAEEITYELLSGDYGAILPIDRGVDVDSLSASLRQMNDIFKEAYGAAVELTDSQFRDLAQWMIDEEILEKTGKWRHHPATQDFVDDVVSAYWQKPVEEISKAPPVPIKNWVTGEVVDEDVIEALGKWTEGVDPDAHLDLPDVPSIGVPPHPEEALRGTYSRETGEWFWARGFHPGSIGTAGGPVFGGVNVTQVGVNKLSIESAYGEPLQEAARALKELGLPDSFEVEYVDYIIGKGDITVSSTVGELSAKKYRQVGNFQVEVPFMTIDEIVDFNSQQWYNTRGVRDAIVYDPTTGRIGVGMSHDDALLELFPKLRGTYDDYVVNGPLESLTSAAQEDLIEIATDDLTVRIYSNSMEEVPEDLLRTLMDASDGEVAGRIVSIEDWGGGQRASLGTVRNLLEGPVTDVGSAAPKIVNNIPQDIYYEMIADPEWPPVGRTGRFSYHPESGMIIIGDFDQPHPIMQMEKYYPQEEWVTAIKYDKGNFSIHIPEGTEPNRFLEMLDEIGVPDNNITVYEGNVVRMSGNRKALREYFEMIATTDFSWQEAFKEVVPAGQIRGVYNKGKWYWSSEGSHALIYIEEGLEQSAEDLQVYASMHVGITMDAGDFPFTEEELYQVAWAAKEQGFPGNMPFKMIDDMGADLMEPTTLDEFLERAFEEELDELPIDPDWFRDRPSIPTRPSFIHDVDDMAFKFRRIFKNRLDGLARGGNSMLLVWNGEKLVWSTKIDFHRPLIQSVGSEGLGDVVTMIVRPDGQLIMGGTEELIPGAIQKLLAEGADPDMPSIITTVSGRKVGTLGEFLAIAPTPGQEFTTIQQFVMDNAQLELRNSQLEKAASDWVQVKESLAEWAERIRMAHARGDFQINPFDQIAHNEGVEAVNELKMSWAEMVDTAAVYAQSEVARVLFDYTAKSSAEELLRYVTPFSTWQLRNPIFWAQAMQERSGLINLMLRYMHMSEVQRRRHNLTQRFQGTIGFDTPGGGYAGVDPAALISIFSQFNEPFITPDQQESYDEAQGVVKHLQWFYQQSQHLGITPWPWVSAALENVGAVPGGTTQISFGPQQRLLEIGLRAAGVLDTPESLFGTSPQSEFLVDYYINRRITELGQEAGLSYQEMIDALDNPEHPLYQQAAEEVKMQQLMSQTYGLFSPIGVKYASPGEVQIREMIEAQRELPTYEERQQMELNNPALRAYRLLFGDEADLAVARVYAEYEPLLEGLHPWEQDYKDLVAERSIRLEELLGDSKTTSELLQEYLANPLESTDPEDLRIGTLFRLSSLEPRAGEFADEEGNIDWEAFNAKHQEFYDSIEHYAALVGDSEVTLEEYLRFRYRNATPDKIAYDLYREWVEEAWDKYEGIQPGGEAFNDALQWALNIQAQKDISAGFTLEETEMLRIDNATKWARDGLPYEYVEMLIADLTGPQDLSRYVGAVANIMGVEGDKEMLEILEGQLSIELPGLFGEQSAADLARSSLYDYYYNLTPAEQSQARDFFDMDYFDLGELEDEELMKMYSKFRHQQWKQRDDRRNMVPFFVTGPEPNNLPTLPPANELTEREKAELELVRVDMFRYQQAREAGLHGEWTALMTKYYSNPDTPQGKFWDALSGVVLLSSAYENPFLGPILNAATRGFVSDEHYEAALEYWERNKDLFIDVVATAEMMRYPDWYEVAQTEQISAVAMRLDDMELLKGEYYSLTPLQRAEWARQNPEQAERLEFYMNQQRAYQVRFPHYLYVYKPWEYRKWYGTRPPDQIDMSNALKLSEDWLQALTDAAAYRSGTGEWTDYMSMFFGPNPQEQAGWERAVMRIYENRSLMSANLSAYYSMGKNDRKVWRDENPEAFEALLRYWSLSAEQRKAYWAGQ